MSFLAVLMMLLTINVIAQPALPEQGYRWVLNQELSDEFDGSTLDLVKWKNTDPTKWIGRVPGLFMAEAVSVSNGKMCMTTDKLSAPQVINGNTFTHQGGHVISQKRVKPGSFIECKMKANKTFMSSTFWLINYSNETTGCDRRTTELDIQECIGYPDSKTQTQRMGSNTHSRNVPAECTQVASGSRGNNVTTPTKCYSDYYTYAAWWKSPTEILFYLNGVYQYTVTPYADFNLEMYIKLVCETYDWSPVPADGGMTGTWDERTTFYDWVRTYTYLAIDEADNGTGSVFTEDVQFTSKPATMNANSLNFSVNYKANNAKKLVLRLKDGLGNVVATTEKSVYAGYGNLQVGVDGTSLGGSYSAEVAIYNSSDNALVDSESYSLTVNAIGTSVIDERSNENVYLKPNPANNSLFVVGLKSATTYEIFSMAGNQFLSGKADVQDAQIDISALPVGSYLMRLKSKDQVESLKFIKEL